MSRVKASLIIILSLVMISSPVSTSACELSCWLGQAHSDCHSAGSGMSTDSDLGDQDINAPAANNTDMNSMDMGSMGMNSVEAESTFVDPGSSASAAEYQTSIAASPMPMSDDLRGNPSRFTRLTIPAARRVPPVDQPGLHNCNRGLCGQVSVLVSPPNCAQSRLVSTSRVPTGVLGLAGVSSGIPPIGIRDPLHTILGRSSLTSILRI